MSCNLTDAEWKLMHRLWEQSPQTITQLTTALSEANTSEDSTTLAISRRHTVRAVSMQRIRMMSASTVPAWITPSPSISFATTP